MKKLIFISLGLLLIGNGCSYKYKANWDTQDRGEGGSDRPACNLEGEEMYPELPCCSDLQPITTTEGKNICISPTDQSATKPNTSTKCIDVGQQAGVNACCPGLVEVPVDDGYSVCGRPPGYKPRVCAAPGEVLTVDTQNCCAGLNAEEHNGQWVCQEI